jgi:glycosyltransferase involved in cell wall biosynthesis
MRFSLLVPCYNAAKYADKFAAHLSLLTKSFDEVIFYDDASTDGTASILTGKGFKVIKAKTNCGPGFARNQLAAAATGDYIHFHDIDDELAPNYLEKTAEVAKSGRYDVILCDVDWYTPGKKELVLSWKYSNSEIKQDALSYTITHPIGGINGLYRKKKFMETGGFNTEVRIWEDADLHVNLAAKNANFYVIEEVLSFAIRYPGSVSEDQTMGWLTRLNFLQKYSQRFTNAVTRLAIGRQAQVTAGKLIMGKQYAQAKTALQLSEACNVKVPDNQNLLWGFLKSVLPASLRIKLRLAQLKQAFRQSNGN